MYGTVARLRFKPGIDPRSIEAEARNRRVPGQVAVYMYQMDRDPQEFFMAVIFEDKNAYFANANSPEQHAFAMKLQEMLAAPPEWNDGEVMSVV